MPSFLFAGLGPRPLLIAGLTLAAAVHAESMTVTASAYNATPAQTDGKPHIGACNERIEPGANTIAVSPDLFKKGLACGKSVTIEGMGTFIVRDKMDDKWTRRIDIHMGRQVEKAEQWGEKEVTISW